MAKSRLLFKSFRDAPQYEIFFVVQLQNSGGTLPFHNKTAFECCVKRFHIVRRLTCHISSYRRWKARPVQAMSLPDACRSRFSHHLNRRNAVEYKRYIQKPHVCLDAYSAKDSCSSGDAKPDLGVSLSHQGQSAHAQTCSQSPNIPSMWNPGRESNAILPPQGHATSAIWICHN